MKCKYSTQGANDYYDEHGEDYYKAREEAFNLYITDILEGYFEKCDDPEILPNLEDAIKYLNEKAEEQFTFPEQGEWLGKQYEGMLGDCADQAYDFERDKKMGL